MNKKRTARVIITTECNLACSYCCNKIPEIQESFKMTTMDQFVEMAKDYDVINISGGEPLMVFDKLMRLLRKIPKSKEVYLYTNGLLNNDNLHKLSGLVDGINLGFHSTEFQNGLGSRDRLFILKSVYTHHYSKFEDIHKNVVVHMNENFHNGDIEKFLSDRAVKCKQWKMNDCNKTPEDRFIF